MGEKCDLLKTMSLVCFKLKRVLMEAGDSGELMDECKGLRHTVD